MRINGSVALVTGANRGIGNAIVTALLEHGATKIYVAARSPEAITDPRLIPIRLDVTDPGEIEAAAQIAQDADILVNNAGIGGAEAQLLDGSLDIARTVMETNVFGPWQMTRAFAPILADNGGGAIVNILSAASWWAMAGAPAYAASKAAAWSLTNATRIALAEQKTLVLGVHSGFVETDFSASVPAPKITSANLAEQVVRALLEDRTEVFADEFTRATRHALAHDIETMQAISPFASNI